MSIFYLSRISKYLRCHKLFTTIIFIFACFLFLYNSKCYASYDENGNYYEYQGNNNEIKCVIPKLVWDCYNYNLNYYQTLYSQNWDGWNKCLFCYRTGAGSDTDTWAFWVIPPTNENFFFTYGADTGGAVDTSVRQWSNSGYWFSINANNIVNTSTLFTKYNSSNNSSSLRLSVSTNLNGFEGYRYPSCRPLYSQIGQLRFDYYDSSSIWWQRYPSFNSPSISGLVANDSYNLQTLSSPFNNIILHNNEVDISSSSILFDVYDDTYGVSTEPFLSLTLNNTSDYYWTNNVDKSYFSFNLSDISKYNSVNGNKYHIFVSYFDNFGNTNTIAYWFQFVFSADVIQNIEDNTQQNINNNLENINNQMEQTNEFLTSDSVNDSDIELPEMEAEDFTFSFFSTAVNSIIDAMNTTTNNETISFVFRDKTYTINSSDFNFLQHNGFELLRQLLPLFWIFSIGLMIYKDAHHRIQKLKEFNWHAMFSDDISVNML